MRLSIQTIYITEEFGEGQNWLYEKLSSKETTSIIQLNQSTNFVKSVPLEQQENTVKKLDISGQQTQWHSRVHARVVVQMTSCK